MPCSNTIRTLSGSLSGLDHALNRSGLWATLDHSTNVTCLAPNDAAFQLAGSPDASLNQTALNGALLCVERDGAYVPLGYDALLC